MISPHSPLRLMLVLSAALAWVWLMPSQSALAGTLPTAVDGQALPSLAPMIERIKPAVVNIQTQSAVRSHLARDRFFEEFFGLPETRRKSQSLGSGVIIDAKRGLIVTNHHVIKGADEISVTLFDGRQFKAELVGADADTDVAVVKIKAQKLQAIPLAARKNLRVGDFVVAVGNPFGLGQTVTSGIVSALGRQSLQGMGYQNFIQTDASINPGNSGGALLNLNGELVGINTAIFSPSGGNIGIGFAIPIDLAQDVMGQLLKFGAVRRGTMGVEVQDLTPQLSEALGLSKDVRGTVITRITNRSPAAKAGLKPGDVVMSVNDQSIHDARALRNLEGLLSVDQPITISFVRQGKPQRTRLKLMPERRSIQGKELDYALAGLQLESLSQKEKDSSLRGLKVTEMVEGSSPFQRGIKVGDLVTHLNGCAINAPQDALNCIASHVDERGLIVTVQRGLRRGNVRIR